MKIITNNLPRALYCFNELSAKERAVFNYITDEQSTENRFVRFKGECHDAVDTQRIVLGDDHSDPVGWAVYVKEGEPLAAWSRIAGDSYWTGLVFRFLDEERVVVGRYYS